MWGLQLIDIIFAEFTHSVVGMIKIHTGIHLTTDAVHCYELQVIRFLLKREIPWREGNIGCLIIKMKDVWNKDLDPIDPDSPTEYENK